MPGCGLPLPSLASIQKVEHETDTTDTESEYESTTHSDETTDTETNYTNTTFAINPQFKNMAQDITDLQDKVEYFKNRCTEKTYELDRYKGLQRAVKAYVIAHDFQSYNDKDLKFREFCDLCDSIGDHKEDYYYKPEITWPNEEYHFDDHEMVLFPLYQQQLHYPH